MSLDGFGEISATQPAGQHRGIQAAAVLPGAVRARHPGIGGVNARNLAARFGSMDALLEANEEQIAETDGVGPKMANTLIEFLSEDRNREMIERLRGLGLQMEQEGGPIPGTEGPLAGKTFVITGTLAQPVARGGHRAARGRGREGHELGVEEDGLPGARRRTRIEARQGREAGDRDPRRDGLLALLG
jgi:hypothetical protein